MAKDKKQPASPEIDENGNAIKTEKFKILNNATKFEPKMLPPAFRSRSRWTHRIILLIIVMAYSLAIGGMAFVLMSDLATKFGIVTTADTTYFMIGMILPIGTMFVAGTFTFWSRTKKFVIHWFEFLMLISAPIILFGTMIYIYLLPNTYTFHKLLQLLAYISIGMGGIPVIGTLLLNVLKTRTFHEAKYRTLWTIPGMVIAAGSSFALYYLVKGDTSIEPKLMPLALSFGAFALGTLLLTFGIVFSNKFSPNRGDAVFTSVRLFISLPTIVLYTTLLAISSMFALGAKMALPLVMSMVVNALILIVFVVYLYFKARIKNLNNTNPLFNQIIIKIFIVSVMIATLVILEKLPSLYAARNYGAMSFALLASASITVLAGVIIAHFMNLVSYSKFFKGTFAAIAATTIIILAIIFVIASLKHAGVIMKIISQQLVSLFIVLAMITELVFLFANILYVVMNLNKTVKKKKKKKSDEFELDENGMPMEDEYDEFDDNDIEKQLELDAERAN